MRKPRAVPAVGEGKRGAQGYLAYLLRQAAAASRRRLDQALAELDLTHPQFVVMTMLRAYPDSTNADLARVALLAPQTVHAIVDTLERRGWAVKRPDPDHGRIQALELTRRGQAVLEQARERALAEEARLKTLLGEAEEPVRRWLVAAAAETAD
jgi:DNA-binding MarR family transcriptional regulator